MSSFFAKLGTGSLGLTRGALAANPLAASLITAGVALPVAAGGLDILSNLDLPGTELEQSIQQRRARTDFAAGVAARERRMQRLRLENLARVAAAMPDVYNQAFAGRRLPRGAVVIGGQPRTDLLAELAEGMTQGTLQGS